jgi:hypothetical protein
MPDRLIHWLVEDMTWGGVFFGASLFLVTIIGSLLVVGFLFVKLRRVVDKRGVAYYVSPRIEGSR